MKLLNIALIVLASGLGLSQPAAAQRYPAKPVRLIVPFAPGGSTDIMARLRGQKLSEALGHQFIVDNRGGAGTVIGTEMAARAQPDGYTLLMTNIAFAINPGLHGKKLPYDSLADLTAMGLIASQPTVLAVHPSLPVRSTADLIKLAKQKPGTLSFASAGSGSVGHIAGEMFKIATGVDMTHVPYKGGGPAVIDLIAGHVMVAFIGMPTTMAHAKTGKVRLVAVTDSKRPSTEPGLPTIARGGVPGYRLDNWIGRFAPASTPEEFQSLLARDIEKFSQVVKQANIRSN